MPGMPQPETREQAEIVMHIARTEADSVRFSARAYSHRWLTERSLPSKLPDKLKPNAERLYPRVVEAVGVSVNFRSKYLAPAAREVQAAMNEAVEDCYANGDTEPEIVRQQMDAARNRALKSLFGGSDG